MELVPFSRGACSLVLLQVKVAEVLYGSGSSHIARTPQLLCTNSTTLKDCSSMQEDQNGLGARKRMHYLFEHFPGEYCWNTFRESPMEVPTRCKDAGTQC